MSAWIISKHLQHLLRRAVLLKKTPAAGTGPSEAVTTHCSSSTPTHIIAQSLPAYNASDVSVSSSSAATPGECQHLISQSDDTPSALSIWDSTTN